MKKEGFFMSHFKTYACNVDNLEFVKAALTDMQLQYEENTEVIDWAKEKQSVALVVVQNGKKIPIGFRIVKDKLELVSDWFMTSFSEKDFTNQLAQMHDKHRVIDICKQNHWTVDYNSIQTNQNGELELIASSWS